MTKQRQHRTGHLGTGCSAVSVALAFAITFALMVVVPAARAQSYTYNKVHDFQGQPDGEHPEAGVTLDRAGNIYGTTNIGGIHNLGMVYKLAPKGSGWVLSDLYSFTGTQDGGDPIARVVFGPDGSLYGTTSSTVFNLKPSASACKTAECFWSETVIAKGLSYPGSGDLVFDSAKDMFGTTTSGGANDDGEVFECIYSNGKYSCSDIYDFTGNDDGAGPNGVILDAAGNLYGTAFDGGMEGYGTVFQLKPAGPPWAEATLYYFICYNYPDGCYPVAGLTFDPSGNLFGATIESDYKSAVDGTAFELFPDGGWNNFKLTEDFPCGDSGVCSTEGGPWRSMFMDSKGNLYGTNYENGAYGYGSVFELINNEDDSWTYQDLYDFCSVQQGRTCIDGAYPLSNVVMDSAGNLYGTAMEGGNGTNCGQAACGVVWELTPSTEH